MSRTKSEKTAAARSSAVPGLIMARRARGWSQRELGARTGLKSAAICHFERGERSPSTENLGKLADILGTSADFLLGRERESKAVGPQIQRLLHLVSHIEGRDLDLLLTQAEAMSKTKS